MSLISFSPIQDGVTGVNAAATNTPLSTIYNDYNGNITDANISASASIAASKISFSSAPAGLAIQLAYTTSATVATGTTIIPNDNTIPQITEGTEFMTLSITPKSATNVLVIEARAYLSANASVGNIGAIFQDSTANALAADTVRNTTSSEQNLLFVRYIMVAGTTSSTTFRFRAGPESAGTVTFNGVGGLQIFSTAVKSDMLITEYKA